MELHGPDFPGKQTKLSPKTTAQGLIESSPVSESCTGSQEKDSTIGSVTMEEEEETGFMPEEGCGAGQRQATKASQTLAPGGVQRPPLGRLPRLFASCTLLDRKSVV